MANVKARRPVFWIPDNNSEKCKNCQTQFSYLTRKHHCRRCGHIFCSACSNNFGSIPNYLPKTIRTVDVNRKVRLCDACTRSITLAKQSRSKVELLSLLPLQVSDLYSLLVVNRSWNNASSYIIAILKGLQHKIAYETYTKIEKRLIKNYWRQFQGHSRLMLQTLQCLQGICTPEFYSEIVRTYKSEKKNTSCKSLFCNTSKCYSEMHIFDLIELLYGPRGAAILENEEAEVWIGGMLLQVDINWMCIFIPYLLSLHITQASQRLIHNYILPRVDESLNFLYKFYYECRLCRAAEDKYADFYVALLERVKQFTSTENRLMLENTDKYIFLMENPTSDKHDKINKLQNVRMPYNPYIIIHHTDLRNVKQLTTYTKPYVVTVQTNEGTKHILIKKEDLRKDRLVVISKYILQHTIKNIKLTPYNVFPISETYGWVEMLEDVQTLYDIQQNTTLQNYILQHNMNLSVHEIRKTFLQSCGSNALLTYMLGIGDRNLHNLLLKRNGHIINIDFSYILGDDPKFDTTEMSISKGMVDMLGGRNSNGFLCLQQFCSDGFKSIRLHSSFWFIILMYVANSKPSLLPYANAKEYVCTFHQERLMHNYTDEECSVRIREIVEKSSSSSWTQIFSEYSHSVSTSIHNLFFDMEL